MRFAALFALFSASLFADPTIKATITPGPWIMCDSFPNFCLMQAPGLETWIVTVQTDAPAEISAFSAQITYVLADGTSSVRTFAFQRDERPYGTDQAGKPIIYTMAFVPLGKVQTPSMIVTGLKSAGLTASVAAK